MKRVAGILLVILVGMGSGWLLLASSGRKRHTAPEGTAPEAPVKHFDLQPTQPAAGGSRALEASKTAPSANAHRVAAEISVNGPEGAVSGAHVKVVALAERNKSRLLDTPDDGHLRVEDLAPGPIRVSVEKAGLVPAEETKLARAGETVLIPFDLQRARLLEGTVRDDDGQTIADARLRLDEPDPKVVGDLVKRGLQEVRSDAKGYFIFPAAPKRILVLDAFALGCLSNRLAIDDTVSKVDVVLKRGTRLLVHAVAAEDGSPVTKGKVWVFHDDPEAPPLGDRALNAAGVAVVAPLPPDTDLLVVSRAEDRSPTFTTVRSPAKGDLPLTLSLAAAGEARGRVHGADGAPIVNAKVIAARQPLQGRQLPLAAVPPVEVHTDGDGRFRLRGLDPASKYDLRVIAKGYAFGGAQGIAPVPGGGEDVDVTLDFVGAPSEKK
jgi:hypothetical protein